MEAGEQPVSRINTGAGGADRSAERDAAELRAMVHSSDLSQGPFLHTAEKDLHPGAVKWDIGVQRPDLEVSDRRGLRWTLCDLLSPLL